MSTLSKSTHVLATHDIPLECDIYQAPDYPKTSPVLLFFHSGGLIAGGRQDIPPWLVQTCVRNKWPLVSASYRLLPQVDGNGLVDDARAAYDFAKKLGPDGDGRERPVIAAGASGGFFMAAMIAHHLRPKPLALLSISGIPTFRHRWFSSSVLNTPEPVTRDQVKHLLAEPVSVGTTPSRVFYLDAVLPSGAKNPSFDASAQVPVDRKGQDPNRGILYDYFLRGNDYVRLVSEADVGFSWAADKLSPQLADWPFTILLQGDADPDVNVDVCASVAESLGAKSKLIIAAGQDHVFGRTSFVEDRDPGMDEVRLAIRTLEDTVAAAVK